MVNYLREKGQAMIEYAVLIPPMLLISTSLNVMIPPTGQGLLCDLDQAFDGGMCDELVQEGEEDVEQPQVPDGGTEISEASTPEPEICVNWSPSTGSSLCSQTEGCDELPGENQGYYMAEDVIETFVIKAGQDYLVYESGITEDGCYNVYISSGSVSWERVGGGRSCKDISHLQVWQVPWCE